ncbi:MAG: cyclic nucleotide-binding domain-containing protein [Acidimicrobiales bacterium]
MRHRPDQTIDNLRNVPLFAECTNRELTKIAALHCRVHVKAGKAVAEQGTVGREFIVIVSGTATVQRDGLDIATLGAGDYFGEIALIAHGRRTATVIAATDLVVDAFSRAEFDQLLEASPELAPRIYAEATRRMHGTAAGKQ